MTSDELLERFLEGRSSAWLDMDYQRQLANNLVQKYPKHILEKALEMYGSKMYSLAFLNPKNMGKVILRCQNHVNINYEVGGNIAERNKEKLQRYSGVTRVGTWCFDDLFEQQ